MSLSVAGLVVYPVKSCGGISLTEARVGRMGIRHDRQWMVTDDHGMFVAQRAEGRRGVGIRTMCLVATAIEGDRLVLTAPDMPSLSLPLAGEDGPRAEVQVWASRTTAVDQGPGAAAWFTEYFSRERPGLYRLVRMPDDGVRVPTDGDSALAFADGYPFLIVSDASLADLNRRLAEPLPMNRFRPNIVITGGPAYGEDDVAAYEIGGITFEGMTTCVRCPITTTDQATAVRGVEPLRTLATYRRDDDGVTFGRNFNHRGEGTLKIGDRVRVREKGDHGDAVPLLRDS